MFATISEWHDEAGGGKTFCLSAFLEVLELGSFSTCHALHPPARDRNSGDGGQYPSEHCGRKVLETLRQCSISTLASSTVFA